MKKRTTFFSLYVGHSCLSLSVSLHSSEKERRGKRGKTERKKVAFSWEFPLAGECACGQGTGRCMRMHREEELFGMQEKTLLCVLMRSQDRRRKRRETGVLLLPSPSAAGRDERVRGEARRRVCTLRPEQGRRQRYEDACQPRTQGKRSLHKNMGRVGVLIVFWKVMKFHGDASLSFR